MRSVLQHFALATAWTIDAISAPDTTTAFVRNMVLDGGFALMALFGYLASCRVGVADDEDESLQ